MFEPITKTHQALQQPTCVSSRLSTYLSCIFATGCSHLSSQRYGDIILDLLSLQSSHSNQLVRIYQTWGIIQLEISSSTRECPWYLTSTEPYRIASFRVLLFDVKPSTPLLCIKPNGAIVGGGGNIVEPTFPSSIPSACWAAHWPHTGHPPTTWLPPGDQSS